MSKIFTETNKYRHHVLSPSGYVSEFSSIDLSRGPWNDLPKAVPRPAETARQEGDCIMFHVRSAKRKTELHAAMRPKKMKNRSIRRKKGGWTDNHICQPFPQQTWLVQMRSSVFGITYRQGYSPLCTPPFVNSFSLIKSLLLGEHFYWLCCPWEGNLRFVDLPSFLTLPLGICSAEPGRDVCGSNLFPSTQAWCACCNGCSFSLSLYCARCLACWVNKPCADGYSDECKNTLEAVFKLECVH